MMNWFSKLFNKKKSELTHEKMERLLNESYKDIVVYHIDTGAINQKMYNGYPVVGLKVVASKMPEFKQMWEMSSVLQGLMPVMIVAKTTHYRTGKYDKYGWDVSGNVIIWDKKKIDYYALSPEWFYVCAHMCSQATSEQCLYDVADFVRNNRVMLERLARERRR